MGALPTREPSIRNAAVTSSEKKPGPQRPARSPWRDAIQSPEHTAGKAENGHRDEGKHGVEGACLQVETARLRHVEIEPSEEDPGDIAETEAGECEQKQCAAAQNRSPGNAGP